MADNLLEGLGVEVGTPYIPQEQMKRSPIAKARILLRNRLLVDYLALKEGFWYEEATYTTKKTEGGKGGKSKTDRLHPSHFGHPKNKAYKKFVVDIIKHHNLQYLPAKAKSEGSWQPMLVEDQIQDKQIATVIYLMRGSENLYGYEERKANKGEEVKRFRVPITLGEGQQTAESVLENYGKTIDTMINRIRDGAVDDKLEAAMKNLSDKMAEAAAKREAEKAKGE